MRGPAPRLLGPPPYLYAGPMSYVNHQGERPLRVLWRLEHDLPGEVFHVAKVAAGQPFVTS